MVPLSLFSIDFNQKESRGIIEYTKLDENSGMVVGIENSNIIWAINDGSANEIYGFDKFGKSMAILNFKKSILQDDSDIEDIAISNINGMNYIILADIGDNVSKRSKCYIYLVPEPKSNEIKSEIEIDKSDIITIEFNYNDGPRDAECLLSDPITNNLYIVTKREENARLYELEYPFSYDKTNVFEYKSKFIFGNNPDIDYTGVTGGDISKDGNQILIRDYNNVWYYERKGNESLLKTFANNPERIDAYIYSFDEPQGESICWDIINSGFYTASEEKSIPNYDAQLYFYSTKTTSIKKKVAEIRINKNIIYNYSNEAIELQFYDYLGRNIISYLCPPSSSYIFESFINQAHFLYISNYSMFYNLR